MNKNQAVAKAAEVETVLATAEMYVSRAQKVIYEYVSAQCGKDRARAMALADELMNRVSDNLTRHAAELWAGKRGGN